MLDDPQLDPMGSLILELRADNDVAGSSGRACAGSSLPEGDAQGAGSYRAFIVISALSVPPHPRVPITFAEYGIRCYGATPQNAFAVWGAVVKALHQVGKARSPTASSSTSRSSSRRHTGPRSRHPAARVTGSIRLTASLQSVTA
jgi:hypothetical protein